MRPSENNNKAILTRKCETTQEGDDTSEINKLQRLQRFRSSRRQELFDYSLNGGKYDALKTQVGVNFAEDDLSEEEEDQAAQLERAQAGMSDAFNQVDAKVKSKLRIKKIKAKAEQEEETIGKFPFKLNRYTIDNRMRPVKLWKGGVNQTDVSTNSSETPPACRGPTWSFPRRPRPRFPPGSPSTPTPQSSPRT